MTIEQGASPRRMAYPRRTLPSRQWNRSIFTRPDTRRPHRTSMLIPAPRAAPTRAELDRPYRHRRNAASCCPPRHRLGASGPPISGPPYAPSAGVPTSASSSGGAGRSRGVRASKAIGDVLQRTIVSNQRTCGQGPNDGPPEAADPSSPISFGYGRYPAVVGLGLKGASQPRVDARLRYPSAPARAWVKDPIRPAPGHSTWACVSALHMHRVNLSIND